MGYVNVNDPKKINEVDPKVAQKTESEDVVALNNEVKKARARRELVQENKLTEDLTNPPPPETPFKVTGGINMGTIDLQEQQRQAKEDARRDREEAQKRIELAEQAAAKAREELQTATLKHVQDNLMTQIESLKNAIQSGSRRDIGAELDSIESVAQKLGLSRGQPGGGDFKAQLELEKFKLENKREDRKFLLEMKKDERMWQLEVKKLEQSAKESEARADAERNKYAMFAALPEQLGGVIAKGLTARAETNSQPAPVRQIAQQPAQQPAPVRAIEAGENEAGELPCPVCKTMVGVGPTTQSTVCAGCGQQFTIKRVPVEEKQDVGA